MHKNVKNQPMTNKQLAMLAHQTNQWWTAVFVQADRFFDALENDKGKELWTDTGNMFIPERYFLITAIYHAIEDLQKLDIELRRTNDFSLKATWDSIMAVTPFQDIKNMRDMNEHSLDYLIDKGQKQNQYNMEVTENGMKIVLNPAWTFIHGKKKIFLFGNVKIDKLLIAMKEVSIVVYMKTEEVFIKNSSIN